MTLEELKVKLSNIEKGLLIEPGLLKLSPVNHIVNYEKDTMNPIYSPYPEFVFEKSSIEEFVINFQSLRHIYQTLKTGDEVQERSGRYRSFGDMFLICKVYYPELTFFDFVTIIVNLDKQNNIDYYFCPHICKRCISKHNELPDSFRRRRNEDEYGIGEEDLNLLLKEKNEELKNEESATTPVS